MHVRELGQDEPADVICAAPNQVMGGVAEKPADLGGEPFELRGRVAASRWTDRPLVRRARWPSWGL